MFAALLSGLIVAGFYLWKALKIRKREKHNQAMRQQAKSENERIERVTPSPSGKRDEEWNIWAASTEEIGSMNIEETFRSISKRCR